MNDYFCVLPFFGAEYNRERQATPCCLLPANTDIKQLQTEMLAEQRPVACQKCWSLEDQGKTSDRQLKNSAFDFYTDRDIQFIEEDCQDGNFSLQILKLYTSNLCNSTCVTCGPGASTSWATLKKVKTFEIISQDQLESIPYKDLVMLSFVGGEPLFEKKNFDILEQLISIGNTDCHISLVSNGSIQLTQKQQTILKQFKNLNICLSIDGIEKRFEYIRYPLKWNILIENIDFFKSLDIDLFVSYTISNLNIFYYNETIEWFNRQRLRYNYNIVSLPNYFSLDALPENIKLELKQELFRQHSVDDDANFSRFLIEIQQQDRLKNISIKDYLPEFYELIKESI
jgi:sulfatase maturation enzyme AslB (radical SAM superfamily)